MAPARNEALRTLAQRVADALPAELVEEVVLTGSVSRGMADEVSDIEMLVVTREPLELEDLALTEWIVNGAIRILTIVFALNRVWRPTTKRVAVRVAPLEIKPDRLAERIEEALTEPDPRRALGVMTNGARLCGARHGTILFGLDFEPGT